MTTGSTASVPARTMRGALKFEVTTSSPHIEAGRRFSVYVKVTNPYETPAEVRSIRARLPVEFRSLGPPERTRRVPSGNSYVEEVEATSPGPKAGTGGESVPPEGAAPEAADTPDTAVLQPGNSTVRSFTVAADKPLFFTPSAYRLDYLVDYALDGVENQDVIEASCNVRAPLWAIITGAVAGAVAGRTLRTVLNRPALFDGWTWPRFFVAVVSLLAHALLAAIVVVAFARKKDTQPVLSIEDFYGGFFIGVLVGYNGPSAFGQVLSPK